MEQGTHRSFVLTLPQKLGHRGAIPLGVYREMATGRKTLLGLKLMKALFSLQKDLYKKRGEGT